MRNRGYIQSQQIIYPTKLSVSMGLFTRLSLLVTDLDHTLVGNDVALARLNQLLDRYRQTLGTKIVYATGRSRTSYQELLQTQALLTPDALIAAVGTEIYPNASTTIDPEWADKLSYSWDRDRIVELASQFTELEPQPQSEQRPFKISYYLPSSAAERILPQLQELLAESGLSAEIIYSGNKDLDILPQGGDKGRAVQFLRDRWQIDPTQSVVCGDSGNDISLFSSGNERGILVGNAQPELRLWYDLHSLDRHYLAVGDCAAGIIEGLKYFRFVE